MTQRRGSSGTAPSAVRSQAGYRTQRGEIVSKHSTLVMRPAEEII
jgi:hypothetical protein